MSKPVDRILILRWLGYLAVPASLVVSLLIVAWMWKPHLIFTTTPITKTFEKYQQFTPTCRAVIGVAPETESFEELKSRFSSTHPDFKSIKIPTRLTTTKFSGDKNEFMVIRCVGVLKLTGDAHHGWMHIGYLEGWSKIWINDHFKLEVYPKKIDVNFSISDEDTGDQAEFTIVSRRVTPLLDLGLASAVPLMFGTDLLELEAIKNLYHYGGREIPLARASLCAGLLLILGISWIFGLRYLDLSWMMVTIMSLIILYSLPIMRHYFPPNSDWAINVLVQLAGIGAMAGFIMSFLRDFSLSRQILGAYVTASVSLFLIFVVGEKILGSRRDGFLMASYIVWASVLAFGAWRSFALAKSLPEKLPRRLRIKMFGFISATGSAAYLLQTWMMTFVPISFADYIALAVVALFTGFLCVDLVFYQQGFFTEKDKREIEEQKRMRLSEALTIGQTAQELLLPLHVVRSHHNLRIEYHCVPHITMAGDWMDSWEGPNGAVIVLIGDVSGKGPAAAIAMASIMTMTRGYGLKGVNLESAIADMSPRLFSLFKGAIVTTWAGVEIQPNGDVLFAGGGSPGWFVVDGANATTVSCRDTMLGLMDAPVSFKSQVLKVSSAAKIISISDGVVDGSRQLRKFVNLADSFSDKNTPHIISEILAFAEAQQIKDDRSLIVIERLGQ